MNWALVKVKENPPSNSDILTFPSDISTPENRPTRLSMIQLSHMAGTPLGPIVGAKIFDWGNTVIKNGQAWSHFFIRLNSRVTDYIVLISGGFASVEITNFVLNVMVMVLLYVCVKRFKWTPPKHRLVSEKALEVFLIQLRSCFPLESNQNDLHINQDYTQGTRWLFKM